MGGKPGRAKELFRIGSGITKGSGGTRSGMDEEPSAKTFDVDACMLDPHCPQKLMSD